LVVKVRVIPDLAEERVTIGEEEDLFLFDERKRKGEEDEKDQVRWEGRKGREGRKNDARRVDDRSEEV